MDFYETESGVEAYIDMAKGYDGSALIEVLTKHLPAGSTVLELGMGPGVDLDILARTYKVTGSDSSQLFVNRYRSSHPEADLLLLDARSPQTERQFAGIYSNKVLHHLSADELHQSFVAQEGLLGSGGIALHSFWRGEQEEEWMEGLRFVYHTEATLADALSDTGFEVLEMVQYSEMEDDDSLYVVLSKL